ncbi:glucose-1-phosphate cytidylyltransferase [Marinomonas piezotolerans]|uniref:Glucose-1-phosphate cytidylyltransferase n=1 Tax=Marinomonas piezotolerans TaxID=2213058 RepID=A0A370U8E8_9GAMM|nr:glucose-1-phosphate cytidylyltransferase [Marinomonas piezotolerans]RDL44042.1 glucose-1-phosphate cytidylyltransferase [Marinomonas piezotolerans]
MKTIILAGGFGTRLAEYTDIVPKPMVEIGGKPIIWHIMNHYARYGHNDFLLALGYKADFVKDYFYNIAFKTSDFRIDMATGECETLSKQVRDWKVSLIDTGLDSMTGGRIKRLKEHLNGERFMVTYGDGLSNVDINELVKFHESHGKMITMTAVRPKARFGELLFSDDGQVTSFKEKPQVDQGWINGGFMVVEPSFLDLIENDATVLEKEPLEKAAAMGELMSFCHEGFWQCMDTKRDRDNLNELWNTGAPWLK